MQLFSIDQALFPHTVKREHGIVPWSVRFLSERQQARREARPDREAKETGAEHMGDRSQR